MADVRSYSTDELKRLTTLSPLNAKPGEFLRNVRGGKTVGLILVGGMVAFDNGNNWPTSMCTYVAPERRVVSFVDKREIDPSVDAMLAELTRRERDAKVSNSRHGGRRVRNTRVGTSGLVLNQRGNDLLRTTDGNYPWLDRDDELVFYVTDDGVIRSSGSSQLTLVS